MGLVQREVEAAGISTISISLSQEVTAKVNPPRAVYTGFPLGHPLGFPGQPSQQMWILRQTLGFLETIDTPGSLVELDPTDTNDTGVHHLSHKN